MSSRPQQVLHEILARGFRAYPRGIANGILFALVFAALAWQRLPHAFILGWLGCALAIALWRLALARSFLGALPAHEELARWAIRAAVGYGATGLVWGAMGAACIHFAPEAREYLAVVAFLIVLFSVLNVQATAAHPLVFRAFLFSAMGPIIAISLLEPAPNYYLRLALEVLVLAVAYAVGRSGHRYLAESVAMRFENVDLLRDLTRQKEELDRANAAKTHFLAAASHDLRQPLQAIVLLVESLQERVHDPETRRMVRSIRSSVTSMASLLNGVLDISKFDAGTVKPEVSHFEVAGLLERLRNNHAEQAARSGLDLRVARSRCVVTSDPILLYRILSNLATNALRYTERGRVLVGCRRRAGGLEIQVWDTGPGIVEEDQRRIFEEFHQLENWQADRDRGLGLGLAIVQRTARLLGHEIRVRSRVGRGSMFSITVPYGDAAAASTTVKRAEFTALAGCRVLVVEDEVDIRAAMTLLLESWGCEVTATASGAGALGLLETLAAPDVVISDYRLPGEENGVRIIRAVLARHPAARGILISGDIAPAVLKEAQASGCHLLHKPIRPARLRALLGSIWRERAGAGRPGEARPEALVP